MAEFFDTFLRMALEAIELPQNTMALLNDPSLTRLEIKNGKAKGVYAGKEFELRVKNAEGMTIVHDK